MKFKIRNGVALSLQQFSEFTVITIRAISNINRGDEIFASYGPEYDFRISTSTEFWYYLQVNTSSPARSLHIIIFVPIGWKIQCYGNTLQRISYGMRNVAAFSRFHLVSTSLQRLKLFSSGFVGKFFHNICRLHIGHQIVINSISFQSAAIHSVLP